MKQPQIRTLIIEDDPMVQEINRQFVEQVDGYKVIGTASNGKAGIQFIKEEKPDLALIDIYMPNQDGLATIKQIRAEGLHTDVIAITAASDIQTIRQVLRLGAVDYIMKPFKYERIRQALANYQIYAHKLKDKEAISQQELDSLLFQQERQVQTELPKGLNSITLEKIKEFLTQQKSAISAEEVAEGIGLARVTARRYLEFMEQTGIVTIQIEYGGIGRPMNLYILRSLSND
jgi:two-component system response regulator DctR